MSEKQKLAVAVGLVLLLVLVGWWTVGAPEWDEDATPGRPTNETAGQPPPGPLPEPPPEIGDREEERGAESDPDETAGGTSAPETAKAAPEAPTRGGMVYGRVVLEGDDDMAGVRLTITTPPLTSGPPLAFAPDVASDGTFRVEALPAGRYRLTARHPRLAAAARWIEIKAESAAGPIEVVFRQGGSLVVSVISAAEEPRPDQPITISGPNARSGKTGPDGRLEVTNLPVGSYRVVFRRNSQEMIRKVAVTEGEATEVVFHEGARISGTVLGPDGEAFEMYIVSLRPVKYGPEGFRQHTTGTISGRNYRIDGIDPGEYRVTVQVLKPDSYVTICGRITLGPGEEKVHDIRVRPTLLAGRITRGDTGQPVGRRDVQVAAHRVRVEDGKVVEHFTSDSAMAFIGEDGRYEFVGMEPGSWELWISPHVKGLNEARRVATVLEGGRIVDFDFELVPKKVGVLRLTILGADGKPVAGGFSFTRIVLREGQKWYTTLRARGREGSAYEFELDAGKRSITASRKGWRIEPEEITAEIEEGRTVEKTCRLIRRGSVLMTVLDAAGEPVEKVRFSARRPGPDGKDLTISVWPLRNGTWEIWIDPGPAEITATAGEASAEPVTVEVKAGEAASRTVRLPE